MEAAFRVRVSTPLSVGWYDPTLVDPENPLRPASLKGVWRWWARAFVGGVLYERGCLRGEPGRVEVLRPSRREAEAVSRAVGITLGLGYAGSREAASSKFRITTRVVRGPRVERARGGPIYLGGRPVELQRFKLLTLGKPPKTVEYVSDGEFEIKISAEGIPREVFTAAVGILAVALTLGGVGKGSRKGLGSLDVVYASEPRHVKLAELVRDVKRAVERLVRDDCGGKPRGLPPMPVVADAAVEGVKVAQIYAVQKAQFPDLHNFFLRPQRTRVLHGDYRAEDDLRKTLSAWALGLPRSQRGTGYESDVERRASTIMLSYHGSGHIYGDGAFLTALISGDWPRRITWSSEYAEEEVEVDEKKIIEAHAAALAEFQEYVKKIGGEVAKVWP
ncbi:RAMP superfamily CRISPR-associated protein [Pyrobaculum neutrophilum]|uniref:CRISPR-associated RAMP protein, Cmr1 family n=1 Tax=Pyrobaculum neutrophilum (strain DSM 2338 / JCM 9278 / NBRC 100436 / V24Sta) TaxID=444157 RepID=B1YCJ5_PYRNV|nr:RAMP superfamily CRISPR-associated protein [Pyrobaculum neutrophilum]ACB39508.1 CRISPR-associated RAMP protein, Cmr1 family [Pyrobaculum neutrophilum V24Sta]